MLITRKSPFTGTIATLDIPVTDFQLAEWQNGKMIQDAMPNISADHREFIKTGITPAEWDILFRGSDGI